MKEVDALIKQLYKASRKGKSHEDIYSMFYTQFVQGMDGQLTTGKVKYKLAKH